MVRPELEGGIEIVRRTLLELKLPIREIYRYADLVRHEGIDESERPSAEQARVLQDIVSATRDLEIGWIEVGADSRLAGRRLADAGLREAAGVSVVGIARGAAMLRTPARKLSSCPATGSRSSERRHRSRRRRKDSGQRSLYLSQKAEVRSTALARGLRARWTRFLGEHKAD